MCSAAIGAVAVLACLMIGFYCGWMVQPRFQASKDKLRVNKTSFPTPPSGTKDMGVMWHSDPMGDPRGQVIKAFLKKLPEPGELREMMAKKDGMKVDLPDSKGIQMWYQVHDDVSLITQGTVHAWLGALNNVHGVTVDPDLHSYTADLVAFLRMQSPNVMLMLRRFHETGKLPDLNENEVKALTTVLTVENILNFSRAPDDRHMQILAKIQNVDRAQDKEGGLHKASSDSLSETGLTPKDRLERDFGVTLKVSRMQDPRQQLQDFVQQRQNPEPSPYSFFPTICVPTVWHVLQYEEEGYTSPGNAYWQNDKPAVDLIECANKNFEEAGMPLRLYLSEWRNDVNAYPYLNLGNFAQWQDCAERAEECTEPIAAQHNIDVQQVLNVFTVGTAACENCCQSCASGYVSHMGDSPDIEQVKSQHLTMLWDRVDPDVDNSPRSNSKGCGTFTHEVGHILGALLHTHTGNCTDEDMVSDTPPNQDGNGVSWRSDLSKWCSEFQHDGHPEWSDLAKFDSCKGDTYIDNIFNFMSYNPSSCRMLFTPGQVQRMVETMYTYRPNLLKNSKCINLT